MDISCRAFIRNLVVKDKVMGVVIVYSVEIGEGKDENVSVKRAIVT